MNEDAAGWRNHRECVTSTLSDPKGNCTFPNGTHVEALIRMMVFGGRSALTEAHSSVEGARTKRKKKRKGIRRPVHKRERERGIRTRRRP